eukprot:TRINITY_DN81_c0_g2_i5.p1 TRINITY_DN81_c0_g2~~TRINITY_DN81_c0_g2_i5.p1  ORF type:complete len:217 (+),score=24.14 TRINITY_DN81_c0_g2_i5:123-773(+)
MIEEVEAASDWWCNQLRRSVQSNELVEAFRRSLTDLILRRFQGHWYEDNIQRGSGFRSICFDNKMDPLISRAAESVGIQKIETLLNHTRHLMMFVNPGEVKLMNLAGNHRSKSLLIFQRGKGRLNHDLMEIKSKEVDSEPAASDSGSDSDDSIPSAPSTLIHYPKTKGSSSSYASHVSIQPMPHHASHMPPPHFISVSQSMHPSHMNMHYVNHLRT